MLFDRKPAEQKRSDFRARLKENKIVRAVGAISPLNAMMIEQKGFEAVYVSGAVVSADLGLPDVGLTTLTEVATRGHQIARVTNLPTIIDMDTGFGEPMNAARTVQILEDMGLAAAHLEDQVNPKRCGHLDGKEVVEISDMVRRIRACVDGRRDPNFALIARCDARAVEGLDAALDRMKAYQDAGADIIFAEAMHNAGDFEAARKVLDIPILANMTEFGKSELLSAKTLEDIGIDIVIYPVTCLRLAMHAIEVGLDEIAETGTQANMLDKMQHRADLYALLRYEDYNRFDQSIYNFQVKKEK